MTSSIPVISNGEEQQHNSFSTAVPVPGSGGRMAASSSMNSFCLPASPLLKTKNSSHHHRSNEHHSPGLLNGKSGTRNPAGLTLQFPPSSPLSTSPRSPKLPPKSPRTVPKSILNLTPKSNSTGTGPNSIMMSKHRKEGMILSFNDSSRSHNGTPLHRVSRPTVLSDSSSSIIHSSIDRGLHFSSSGDHASHSGSSMQHHPDQPSQAQFDRYMRDQMSQHQREQELNIKRRQEQYRHDSHVRYSESSRRRAKSVEAIRLLERASLSKDTQPQQLVRKGLLIKTEPNSNNNHHNESERMPTSHERQAAANHAQSSTTCNHNSSHSSARGGGLRHQGSTCSTASGCSSSSCCSGTTNTTTASGHNNNCSHNCKRVTSLNGPSRGNSQDDSDMYNGQTQSGVLNVLKINGNRYNNITNKDILFKQQIGSGVCGTVWKCEHKGTGVRMAVKVMTVTGNRQSDQQMFRDIQVNNLQHTCPYIVTSFGCVLTEQSIYICMEQMETCLEKLLKERNAQFEEHILARLAYCTLHALDYLKTQQNLMHRDIKPSNILVSESGVFKLCDFGICGKLVNSNASTRSVGCVAYLAPERVDPSATYDVRADVWALGITIMELALQKYPYYKFDSCASEFEVLVMIKDDPAPRLPPAPFSEQVRSFTELCVQKKRENRPKHRELLKHPFIMHKGQFTSDHDVVNWLRKYQKNSVTKDGNNHES